MAQMGTDSGLKNTRNIPTVWEGAFLGIYSNDPKKKNGKNAKYAQAAVSILKTDLSKKYTAKELWSIVGKGKTHNSQMDIVLILWEYGKIK